MIISDIPIAATSHQFCIFMVSITCNPFPLFSNLQEVHHESIASSRFPSAVSPSQLEKNTIKTCEFVLSRFAVQFGTRDLASIYTEEVLGFLLSLTKDNELTGEVFSIF